MSNDPGEYQVLCDFSLVVVNIDKFIILTESLLQT